MAKNRMNHYRIVSLGVFFGLLFIPTSLVLATTVDRVSLCNLEGLPGETLETKITLKGTEFEERYGSWYTDYKKIERDNNRMDITSWIVTEPKDVILANGESKVFTVKVTIPKDAKPGLWGAISQKACLAGKSQERRTYVIYKDSVAGGNVYAGFLLPISVNVLENQNPLA